VDEVVRTYIRLRQLTAIEEQNGDLFSDSLQFTTMLSAGATPMLTLSKGGRGLRLTNASISLNADRTDIHKVDIALAYDKKERGGGGGGQAGVIGKNKVAVAGRQLAFYPPPQPQGKGLGKRVQDAGGSAPPGRGNGDSNGGFNPLECERWQVLEKDVLRDARTIEALVRRWLDARNRVLDRLRDLREDETSAATRLGQRLLEIMRLP
jgi:hypothetical protein